MIIKVRSDEVFRIPPESKGDSSDGGSGGEQSGPPAPSTLDDHEPWENQDIPPQLVREVTKKAVQEAYSNAKSRGIGKMGGDLKKMIEDFLASKVNWRRELRKWIGDRIKVGTRRTRKRPSRRFSWEFPGTQALRGARVWVAVDNSGSVTEQEMRQFFGELAKMLDVAEIVLIVWDTRIVSIDPIRSKGHLRKLMDAIGGGGGTAVNVVFDALRPEARLQIKQSDVRNAKVLLQRPDGIIVLTDGDVIWPEPAAGQGIPVLWGITHERNMEGPQFGKPLYIEVEE